MTHNDTTSTTMKILYPCILLLISILITSCTHKAVRYDNISVTADNRTTYQNITSADKQEIYELSKAIQALSPQVDKAEASLVAYEAVLYPKVLANRYQLMAPPNYHNQLVNAGKRKKGHCYHFAQDMMKHLNRPYKTLTLQRVMAFQGKYLEHNVPTIRARGQDISEAIILDAWRESARLVWMKVKEDEAYPWVPYVPKKPVISTHTSSIRGKITR